MLTVAEFARRAGVSRQAIYKAIKSGKLKSVNGKIDETAPECAEYMSGSNPSVPRQVRPARGRPQTIGTSDPMTDRARIDAEKAKQQAIHWQIRNARDRGALIDRELVARAIEITDSEHKRLLADGAQTIAKMAFDLVKTDATKEEVIESVRAEISGALKSWKSQIARTLKLFYDE